MKPRCNACISFFEAISRDQFKIIYDMKIFKFAGYCAKFKDENIEKPFFFSMRNRNDTCKNWKWRGKS